MNLQALRAALVDACADQGLFLYHDVPNMPELPCLYCGMPLDMREWSSPGSCTLDIALTLCVSRADEDVAQKQLSDFISTLQIPMAVMSATRIQWVDVAFVNIDNFRPASFGESMQVLAADFNFSIRTKETSNVIHTTQGQPEDGRDDAEHGYQSVGDQADADAHP